MRRSTRMMVGSVMAMVLALPAGAGGDAWEYPELEDRGWPTLEQGATVRAVAPLFGWSAPESWKYPLGQPMLAYLVPENDHQWNAPASLPSTGHLVGVIRPIPGSVTLHGQQYGSTVHLVADIEIPAVEPGTYWLANCDLTCSHELGGFTSAGITVVAGSGRPADVVAAEVRAEADIAERARLLSLDGLVETIQPITSFAEAQAPPSPHVTDEQRAAPPSPTPGQIDDREQALVDLVSEGVPAREPTGPNEEALAVPGIEPDALSAQMSDGSWPALPVALAVASLLAGATVRRRPERRTDAAVDEDRDALVLVSH